MKTYEQHLQELPEPARSKALANLWWEDKSNRCALQSYALRQAFNWSKSPEGWLYWKNVYQDIVTVDCLISKK